MKIVFVSDYVCPYCLVAKEALKQAIKELNIEVEMEYQSFELIEEPKPRIDTYHNAQKREAYKILEKPCKELKLDMKIPPKVIPRPYTRLAFEGYFYAKEKGCEESYNDLVYRAYFIDERNIEDLDVLCELAEKAGLDKVEYREVLEKGIYKEIEAKSTRYAKRDLEVKVIPTIFINGKRIIFDHYTKDEAISVLEDALAEEIKSKK